MSDWSVTDNHTHWALIPIHPYVRLYALRNSIGEYMYSSKQLRPEVKQAIAHKVFTLPEYAPHSEPLWELIPVHSINDEWKVQFHIRSIYNDEYLLAGPASENSDDFFAYTDAEKLDGVTMTWILTAEADEVDIASIARNLKTRTDDQSSDDDSIGDQGSDDDSTGDQNSNDQNSNYQNSNDYEPDDD